MTDQDGKQPYDTTPAPLDEEPTQEERREFLRSLGKWSQAVIGGVLLGGAVTLAPGGGGGGWVNRRGGYGGGGAWVNR